MNYLEKGKEILRKINSLGYEAYIVGGTVRDFLLDKEINDIDLTTNMPLELLKDYFIIKDNGSDYLSVTIVEENMDFEITHFRCDVSYSDHRHPEVKLVDTYLEDSNRRDFTINALAMDKDGNIIDYHNGKNDLKEKIIRTIGNPFERFEEDALRILRGLYFASKLGFDIEPDTLFAMVDKKELLSSLSEERIYQYFLKLVYADTDKGIRCINECDIFQYIPSFKRWLNIVDKNMKKEDLMLVYYAKMKRFPVTPSKEDTKLAKIYDVLSVNNDLYTLYNNKEGYYRLRDVLKLYGYDIISLDEKISGLVLNNDNDLAVSKEEIASKFESRDKALAIRMIIEAILNKEINNTKSEIMERLSRGVLHV